MLKECKSTQDGREEKPAKMRGEVAESGMLGILEPDESITDRDTNVGTARCKVTVVYLA